MLEAEGAYEVSSQSDNGVFHVDFVEHVEFGIANQPNRAQTFLRNLLYKEISNKTIYLD